MKEELKQLAERWSTQATAWRESAKRQQDLSPTVSARNYARAYVLEGCLDELEQILLRYEKP